MKVANRKWVHSMPGRVGGQSSYKVCRKDISGMKCGVRDKKIHINGIRLNVVGFK